MNDEILKEARVMLDLAISSLQRAGHDTEQFERTVSKIKAQQALTPDELKSFPTDEEVKAHIDTLPYYGTCTTEYNEGFEDGVKWIKEKQLLDTPDERQSEELKCGMKHNEPNCNCDFKHCQEQGW